MVSKTVFVILTWSLSVLLPAGFAQEIHETSGDRVIRLKAWDDHVKLERESIFKDLKWRVVGPVFQGGRIESVACLADEPFTMYVAPGAGNLWKTVNNGVTWEAIFEKESTFAIGCVAVSRSNSDIVWVGTGEAHLSGSSYSGTGVFKSTDAGQTWKNMGLYESSHIGKVIIDPENSDIVYVGVIGDRNRSHQQRGVFKTTDGGKTWERVLFITDRVGIIDMVMDPCDRQTLYAASWQRNGGIHSGVHKTTDGGKTWKRLGGGLPQTEEIGRVAVDVSASDPNVVYALLVDHAKPGGGRYGVGGVVYRSDDRGEAWVKTHTGYIPTYVGWDFCDIKISPDDECNIYICGFKLLISKDAGKSFQEAGEKVVRLHRHLGENILHLDHHELWIDPVNPDRLVSGNDGGLFVSYDRGQTWLHLNNLPIAEFYTVSVDMAKPYNIYGGTQDNASLYGPGNHTVQDGVEDPWQHIFLDRWAGGDGFVTLIDPTDSNVIYYEQQNGDMKRKRMDGPIWAGGRSEKRIRPKAPEGESRLSFAWNTPFVISNHNPHTLYCAANRVFKSYTRGDDWECISPDFGGSISTLSESSVKPGLIYIGARRGVVQVTRDDGKNWTMINEGMQNRSVRRINASSHEEATVYAALSGQGDDIFNAYVYMSTDYGKTWRFISSNLPAERANVVIEDPRDKNILYVGTDLGVYASLNRGKTWISLCNHLPSVSVLDMVVHPRDFELVIATHGRSIFVLDVNNIQDFVPVQPRTTGANGTSGAGE